MVSQKIVYCTILILLIPSMAEAARVAEANYEVTPNQLKITGTITFSGQDSSDFRALVDEVLGNDDGELEAWEVDEFEDWQEEDAESSHTMNTNRGTVLSALSQVSGATGPIDSTDTITNYFEMIVAFESVDSSSESFTLKFLTEEDAAPDVVEYRFEGYQVVSAEGLAGMDIGSDYVKGTRDPGVMMVIEFEEKEGFLPGFLTHSLMISVTIAALIFPKYRRKD